jgi:hypothetical protein
MLLRKAVVKAQEFSKNLAETQTKGIPQARPFFAASAALGTVLGFFLWLRHR